MSIDTAAGELTVGQLASRTGVRAVGACAAICQSCGDECERHANMPHCRVCAEACRRCDRACRDLLDAWH
jgi:hypothetical protein